MGPASQENEQTSAILTAQHGNDAERRQAAEHIIAAHWKPLYKYLRFRHNRSPEDAQALMAKFLEDVLRPGFFRRFDPLAGPLRNFLRNELDRFDRRWKGGQSALHSLPIDFAAAEEEYQSEVHFQGVAADDYYEGEWVRNLFALAVGELHATLAAEGKSDHFTLFLQSDLQEKTGGERAFLDETAKGLGMPINDAMNALASTRRTFHHIIMDIVRSLTTTEAEFRQEMQKTFK